MKLMMNYSVYKILKINALISLRNVRNLSSSPMNGYYYEQPKSRSRISSFDSKVNTVGHPYDQLFPWKSLTEFSRHLADNKVYFDGNLLAISKPWGVGIHKVNVNVTDKNSYLSTSFITGSPQYCLTDSIQHLCQIFNVKHLNICKTISRYMSGIVLFATDSQTENKVIRAIRQSQSLESPAMTFWCLTKGWPIINNHQMRERVGIKLLELDELGDHKQPIIISPEQLTNKMRRRRIAQTDGMVVKPALVDLKTIDMNKTLGVSLVELSTNVQKWHFIECYLAYKTSFIFGDNRFCRQVKHVLGTPMSIKPDKINFAQDYEPLSPNILKKLNIRGNGYIPLHIHHKRLVLPSYLSKKDKKDLVIETEKIPDFFEWSLNRLEIKTNY